ncbi:DUF2189 domain-containing protein [Sedimenticola hydrogenitrophicus]|uniref:DUF2189 domain-containing protein n=1 Tax=Sedimenticola hydrogenitrophicus TaxID=2967975 RepID=UPI0021A49029|nr:DUF2189 domain-containing protein [Sedimenticola hydrogenitrophicus]
MSHTILSTYADHRKIAEVEDISTDQPWNWLVAGWRDVRRTPATSIGYGVLITIASYLLTLGTVVSGLYYLIPVLLGGFFLVAPALGLGLYEVSRRIEQDEPANFMHALRAIWRHSFAVSTMGAAMVVCFIAWFLAANLIFMVLSSGITPTIENAIPYLFSLENLPMLAVGTLVGALFALGVFSLTVVSVPMLLDRNDVDVMSAMRVSFEAFRFNLVPMLVWAGLIVLVIIGGFMTLYVGLAIGFPMVAYASWHAYRDVVKK